MGGAGLNVLRPSTDLPARRGRYTVSASPAGEPLGGTGWRNEEPALLRVAMTLWEHFASDLLQPLDIPGYTGTRISDASISPEAALHSAADWCHQQREAISAQYPWHQLAEMGGCVHGDPNLGNLIRLKSLPTPLFIDLDSVKYGPRYYDLAVMQLYAVRLDANYPWPAILSGYERAGAAVDTEALRGLRHWKELSSATQLLTRWSQPSVAAEFWRRTALEESAPWGNVTKTLVQVG
jgi:Phosphotransferase enzyme family